MGLQVASYNVLADDYIVPERYPRSPASVLDPAWRHSAVATRAAGLGADVLCLQEVERPMLAAITRALPEHERHYAPKPGRKDGVAMLSRAPCSMMRTLYFSDDTARVALLVVIELDGRPLGIANTHLKLDQAIGLAQANQLVDAIAAFEPVCAGWLVCGDLNASPSSEILHRLRAAGFHDSHEGRDEYTSNFSGGRKRIDFVLASSAVRLTPVALPPLEPDAALPSRDEPSDHIPVQAHVTWASEIAGTQRTEILGDRSEPPGI